MKLYTLNENWHQEEAAGTNIIAYFNTKEEAENALRETRKYYKIDEFDLIVYKNYTEAYFTTGEIDIEIGKFDLSMLVSRSEVLSPDYSKEDPVYDSFEDYFYSTLTTPEE